MIQGGSRLVAEPVVPSVSVRKDQSIQDGFGSTGLDGFIAFVVMIAVVRSDLLPKTYTLADVVKKSAFALRPSVAREWLTQGSARQRVGEGRVTGNAKRLVIAGSPLPSHPPVGSLIEVSTCGRPTPTAGGLSFGARAGGKTRHAQESPHATYLRHSRGHTNRLISTECA